MNDDESLRIEIANLKEFVREQIGSIGQRLDKILDQDDGLFARNAALTYRVETLEKQIDRFTTRAWWLVGAVVVEAINMVKQWIVG